METICILRIKGALCFVQLRLDMQVGLPNYVVVDAVAGRYLVESAKLEDHPVGILFEIIPEEALPDSHVESGESRKYVFQRAGEKVRVDILTELDRQSEYV